MTYESGSRTRRVLTRIDVLLRYPWNLKVLPVKDEIVFTKKSTLSKLFLDLARRCHTIVTSFTKKPAEASATMENEILDL